MTIDIQSFAITFAREGDLSSRLVCEGRALYPRHSAGAYKGEQQKAKAEKRGIWRGRFEMPWDWRRKRAQ